MDNLLNACRDYTGGEPTDTLRQVTGQFIARARNDIAVLKMAAEALPTLPPPGAAWLAIAMGAVIESSEGAEQSAPAIVDLFLSWLPALPASRVAGAELSAPTPQQAELLQAFLRLAPSVVSHLARSPQHREKLSHDIELLNRLETLEEYSAGAAWIREMLLRSSGTLIILHPPSEKGFRLRYENVATCFHLFSLLQTAIGERISGGRKPNPVIAASARGKSQGEVTDEAWWHYGDPRSKTANLGSSIWGEALVREIPVVNDAQVVLLWPPILKSRVWGSDFFGPQLDALKPDVSVEQELSKEACDAWFQTLGIRGGARRRWWPW